MPKKNPIDMSAMLKEARRAEELAVAKALIVREAAIAAAQTFRHYAQIHRDKGDEAKAARNEDEAVKLTLAIMATANLPDFRALSKQLTADLDTARAEAAALREEVEAMREVVEEAERLTTALASSRILSRGNARVVSPPGLGLDESQGRAVAALDALRARKVGG